jgi:hypothetical protein
MESLIRRKETDIYDDKTSMAVSATLNRQEITHKREKYN